jgi:hypothetical protein
MRNISSFYGDYCVVGRGWAGDINEIDDPQAEIPWYVLDTSHNHDPGNSYYIDIQSGVAADMVTDYSKEISQDKIPDNKFLVTILEFLPYSCFEEGTWTIKNALRTTKKNPGWIVVLSRGDIINLAFTRMQELGLDPVIEPYTQKKHFPGWYVKRMSPDYDILDTDIITEEDNMSRLYAYLGDE